MPGERDQAEHQRRARDDQEPGLVEGQARPVDLDEAGPRRGPPASRPSAAHEQEDADDGVREGGQHQRAAQRGPDADLLAGLAGPGEHRDQRDDALGQRRADRGQDGADGHGADAELDPEPLDGVHEPLARQVDRGRAADQQQHVDGGHAAPLRTQGDTLPRPSAACQDAPVTRALDFRPVLDHPDLWGCRVDRCFGRCRPSSAAVRVAAIDPDLADTAAFCAAYGFAPEASANCVVVAGRRDGVERYAACVVLATTRADVNGLVRRHLDVRKLSFARLDDAVR